MAIERVNLTFNGGQSSKEASGGAMSADGRYVVFISNDKDILGGPARGDEVYLRDMQTGENQLISKGYNGDTVGGMIGVGISGDGRYVVYGSNADNIVEGDNDGLGDVFVYDRQTGVTKMVSSSTEHNTYFSGAVATDGSSLAYWEDRGNKDRIVARGLTNDTVFWDSDTEEDWDNFTFSAWEVKQVAVGMADSPRYAGHLLNTRTTSYYKDKLYATNGYWTGPYGEVDAWNQRFSIAAGGSEVPPGQGGGFAAKLWLYRSGNYSANLVGFDSNGPGGHHSYMQTSKTQPGVLIRTESGALTDNGNTAFYASNFDFGADKFIEGFAIFAWDTRTGVYNREDGSHTAPVVRMIVQIKDVASNPFYDLRSSANGRYLTFLTSKAVTEDDTNGVTDIYRVLNPLWDGAGGGEDPDPGSDDWIMGTNNDDVLLGTAKDDRIDALAGDDDVEGGQGDDEIYGRQGDDKIWGGAGDDEIEGGDGNDVIAGDYGDNAAGGGDDILSGGKGDDIIHGETGDDKLWGDEGDDELYGEDGKDALVGGDGDDKLYGGKGDDKLTGGKGSDTIIGGDEADHSDKDIAIYEGSPDDYTFLDSYSPQRKDYTTTVTEKDSDDVDTVVGVERAQFEHLANNAVDPQSAILTFAQAANTAYNDVANLGHGWRALSALELGMRSTGEFADNLYTYKNGVYSAKADTDLPGVDPVVEASAQVYFGVVDGKNTLMLAFRGTDEAADGLDYPKFALHYARFQPLIEAVLGYVEADGYNTGGDAIEQVMVTGHSLGGAMVQMFMQDARVAGDNLYTAATFGSPGAEKNLGDPRIIHVEHSADLVPLSGDAARLGAALAFPALSQLLQQFGDNPATFRTSGGVIRVSLQESDSPLSQHSMDHYQDTAARIDDQAELLGKLGYTGAPGSVFNLVVGSRGVDHLEGANPILPKVLRGLDYFDGSEVFLSGEGADFIRGGAGGDIFAGYAADLEGDVIDDFAQGDAIKIFDFSGPQTVVYNRYVSGNGSLRVLEIGGVTLFLGGYQPGTFKIAVDAQGVATVTYEGIFSFTGDDDANDISGGDGDDQLAGGGGDDQLSGGGGDDRIAGGSGSDKLSGGAGNDRLFGGEDPDASLQSGGRSAAPSERGLAAPADEIDTAVYEGLRSQYRAQIDDDGVVTITDLRTGSPEGVDTLHDFEAFQFADKTYTLAELMNPPPPTGGGGGGGGGDPEPNPGQDPGSAGGWSPTQVVSMFGRAALGVAPDAATSKLLQSLAEQTLAGTLSQEAAMRQIIDLQDATTAVALQTYQFFTGKSPSAAGLAWLVHSPDNANDLNDPYYAAFNQESRYINFAVNLGVDNAEASMVFRQIYGGMIPADFIEAAYNQIIGINEAVAHGVDVDAALAYLGRAENMAFLNQLAADRGLAATPDVMVRAALIGQIMSIGAGVDWAKYSEASSGYLADLMLDDLGSNDPIDLVGTYGKQIAGLSWEG